MARERVAYYRRRLPPPSRPAVRPSPARDAPERLPMPLKTTAVVEERPPAARGAESWHSRTLRATSDIAAAVGPILDALARLGYSEAEAFAVRLSLEEALVNAS